MPNAMLSADHCLALNASKIARIVSSFTPSPWKGGHTQARTWVGAK